MKHLQILGVSTAFILLVGLVVAIGTADSHRMNLRYLLWKHHLVSYEPTLSLKYFNVDADFRLSLYGKSRSQVEQWFPVLNPVDPSDPYLPFCGDLVKQPGFVWIDHSRWGILFENDKVKEIRLFKG